jgi:hypothetical protein
MTVETVSTVEEQLGFPTHAEHVRTGWASARRLARRLDVVLLLLLALVPLWRFTNGAWTNYDTDAFTYLYDASRIVHGQVPYRDFFNFIGPAALWLPAAWMAIFGVSGDGAQVLLVAILALLGAALYAVTLQLTRRRLLSLFAPAFVLLTMPVHFPWPYHNWYGAPLSSPHCSPCQHGCAPAACAGWSWAGSAARRPGFWCRRTGSRWARPWAASSSSGPTTGGWSLAQRPRSHLDWPWCWCP